MIKWIVDFNFGWKNDIFHIFPLISPELMKRFGNLVEVHLLVMHLSLITYNILPYRSFATRDIRN